MGIVSRVVRALLKKSNFLTGLVHAFRQIPSDTRHLVWSWSRRGDIRRYLETHEVRKMQIGSGYNSLGGWLNADYVPRPGAGQIFLDARRPFPFPDGSFHFIFSEHMIEHIWFTEAQSMLKECHRVLKPGGVIRISTPNLRNVASLLFAPDNQIKQTYIKLATDKYIPHAINYRPGFVVNNFFWDFGHYFVYDEETLELALQAAGFSNVKLVQPLESDHAELRGLESHQKIVGDEINRFESIIMEASRGSDA
ncbi:MAG: methyltransferase domain-containing protein [Verrucomicrobiota bacterium]